MKTALVGYTGFVGSNLFASHRFEDVYNSKNIKRAYGTKPDLLIYAGLPSAMFKANDNPDLDYIDILKSIDNLKEIRAKKVVLISTVAVYDKTIDVDETYNIEEKNLSPYGKNRFYLEKWVLENCKDSLIIRLPALYGINLKKNFIYDYINLIPMMLNEKKFQELVAANSLIGRAYQKQNDNYYHFVAIGDEKKKLYEYFNSARFNALYFTDSRSVYQFYNLGRLWSDIQVALINKIQIFNIATEPVRVDEVYKELSGNDFNNILTNTPYNYDIKSIYADLFGGANGYLVNKTDELADLKCFVYEEKKRLWG